MKLEMKAIKVAEFATQETYCYRANIYLNNKKIASVRNDGNGGADFVEPAGDGQEGRLAFNESMKEINDYFATLSADHPLWDVEKQYGIQPDFDIWCGEQVTDFLVKKDLKSSLKKAVVGIRDGKCFEWTHKQFKTHTAQVVEMVKKNNPTAQILNNMNFDEALALYKTAA